jgi:hypothetical protein
MIMNYPFTNLLRLCLVLLLVSCAPQVTENDPASESSPERVDADPIPGRSSAEILESDDTLQPSVEPVSSAEKDSSEDPAVEPEVSSRIPDWKQRYEDLQVMYASKFRPPLAGQPVRIQLVSGRFQEGVLETITQEELVLNLPNGSISYPKESLHPYTKKELYASEFAEHYALLQATEEYNIWLREEPSQLASSEQKARSAVDLSGSADHRNKPEPSMKERIPMFPIPPELLGR